MIALPLALVAGSTWRLRVTGRETTWALTEVRFFAHQNCTGKLAVSNVEASGVDARSSRMAMIVHPSKAFDGSSFGYWKGKGDYCGDMWIAADLPMEAPGCVEIYQSYGGVSVTHVAFELWASPDWLTVDVFGPLEECPRNVLNCCPGFDDVLDKSSGCDARKGQGVSAFPVAFASATAYDRALTCPLPSSPPPSPPPPAPPPTPSPPPAGPPGQVWVDVVVPAGVAKGACFEVTVADAGLIQACVPAGAAPGDLIHVLARQLLPPSPALPPSVPPGSSGGIVGTTSNVAESDDNSASVTGLAVGFGLVCCCAFVLLYIVLSQGYFGRKSRLTELSYSFKAGPSFGFKSFHRGGGGPPSPSTFSPALAAKQELPVEPKTEMPVRSDAL